MPERLADDQGALVRRDDHAVGEHELGRGDVNLPVGVDARERGRALRRVRDQVEAEVPDVRAAVSVHDHVVAVERGDVAELGVDREPAGVEPHELAVVHRHDQQPSVRQPAQPRRVVGDLDHRLGAAVERSATRARACPRTRTSHRASAGPRGSTDRRPEQ